MGPVGQLNTERQFAMTSFGQATRAQDNALRLASAAAELKTAIDDLAEANDNAGRLGRHMVICERRDWCGAAL